MKLSVTHTRGELGSGRDCSQHLLSRVSGLKRNRQGPLKLFQPTETQDGVVAGGGGGESGQIDGVK